jgi:tetratricopeptide (TPR) repeat protein
LNPVALEILERIERQDLDGARTLVAWVRDSLPATVPSDPYAAPPLLAFWDAGQRDGDSRAVTLAAAAIAVGPKQTAARAVMLLEHALADSSDDTERKRIEPALLFGYEALRRHEPALKMARAMTARSPHSVRAFYAVAAHLQALGRFSEAEEFARQRLQANADDIDALRVLARNSAAQHRYAEAYERAIDVTRSGASGLNDQNNAAWLSLFFDREGGPDIDAAIRAAGQPGNATLAAMHTLACVYAEFGKAREARDLLIQVMAARNQVWPDEAIWYGFGRIAELYGERDIALEDYAKVRPSEDPATDFDSTFALTQRRLAVLGHPAAEDARPRTR